MGTWWRCLSCFGQTNSWFVCHIWSFFNRAVLCVCNLADKSIVCGGKDLRLKTTQKAILGQSWGLVPHLGNQRVWQVWPWPLCHGHKLSTCSSAITGFAKGCRTDNTHFLPAWHLYEVTKQARLVRAKAALVAPHGGGGGHTDDHDPGENFNRFRPEKMKQTDLPLTDLPLTSTVGLSPRHSFLEM